MRPDVHISALNLKFDPAVKTYASLLAMDARFSNPTHMVAASMFVDSLMELRRRGKLSSGEQLPDSKEQQIVELSNPLGSAARGSAKEFPAIILPLPLHSPPHTQQHGCSTLAPSKDAARQRARRVRSRWWLALLLLNHPELIKYRVRGPIHEHHHHAHGVGEVAYHYAAGIFC